MKEKIYYIYTYSLFSVNFMDVSRHPPAGLYVICDRFLRASVRENNEGVSNGFSKNCPNLLNFFEFDIEIM